MTARLGALVAMVVLGGCGGAPEASERPVAAAPARPDSNARRLTHAQSVRIVDWATDFRRCAVGRGLEIDPIAVSETRIEMTLGPGLEAGDVIPKTTACAEKKGGPPEGVSLLYRPGRILLYLPKQCLLDEKVAAKGVE